MGRQSLGNTDYRDMGDSKGLEFIGDAGDSPVSVLTPTTWRCKLTGVVLRKSYHAVKNGPSYGSRYAARFPESFQMYQAVAKRLGISFMYDPQDPEALFPANTKTGCLWRGANNAEVWTTYNQLAYTPRQYLQDALGIRYDDSTHTAQPIQAEAAV